jgi:phage shock protein PspC (stress-responsive transcriptional regulator)
MRDRSSSHRRLELDRENGMIIGLCAGLARYFNADVTWVRVGAIVGAVFLTKAAIAAYVIGWLLLNERAD